MQYHCQTNHLNCQPLSRQSKRFGRSGGDQVNEILFCSTGCILKYHYVFRRSSCRSGERKRRGWVPFHLMILLLDGISVFHKENSELSEYYIITYILIFNSIYN